MKKLRATAKPSTLTLVGCHWRMPTKKDCRRAAIGLERLCPFQIPS